MRTTLALVFAVAFAACAPALEGSSGDDDPTGDAGLGSPGQDGRPDPSDPPPSSDPSLCEGDGTDGSTCEVTADCISPTVCINDVCVGPRDPDFRCDPIEGIVCDGAGEVCVAGVCVVDPGVPGDGQCLKPGSGPELTGVWKMRSTLHLREGLPGFTEGFLDVTEVLADFINGEIDLGLPSFVEVLIGSLVSGIIDSYVPDWAQDLVLVLAGFSDVLDNLQVDQTVWMHGLPCAANYRASSRWDWITFEYRGTVITARPEDISEIGSVEPEDFGARYSCGSVYIDRHRIKNVLNGLIRWMLDSLVEATTGYSSIESALNAAVNCGAIANGLNDAWQSACGCSTDIRSAVQAKCNDYKSDMLDKLGRLIDEAAIKMSVVTLQGIATVPDSGTQMLNGTWYGELIDRDFPGEFSADRL